MAIIERLDGRTFDLKDLGIRTKDIIIPYPEPRHHSGEIEGRNGAVDYGTEYGPRIITAIFSLQSYDYTNYPLSRDDVFHLFRSKEPFYLTEKRRPGKRWLVKVNGSFSLDQRYVYGDFTVELITTELPFSESIGTTQDIQEKGIAASDALWGFGLGLIADDESLVYTHTNETNFKIYNAGNEEVHPYEQDLKIDIYFPLSVQSSDFFELRNNTNGTTFRINEQVLPLQRFLIDGPKVTRNGLNALRLTNRQFISLDPGWNEFEVSGNWLATISFDFRFYYL